MAQGSNPVGAGSMLTSRSWLHLVSLLRRVAQRRPGRGRRAPSLSAPQLLELNVGWLSELREALPSLPCLRQLLLLVPPEPAAGGAVAMDALRALVGSTMDRCPPG